jgi:3-hexulose-6-phosphate synthase/6-phospho-3-hexuloisomerase
VAEAVTIPVAVAGGINSETAAEAVQAGASIVVVGGAITKATDATEATRQIKHAVGHLVSLKSDYFVRASEQSLREQLLRVSSANVSDALHRGGWLPGVESRLPGAKLVGPAVTVRTHPGDWAKPVEAIDHANEGDVIVIDAGGVGPAIWGELATHSALEKKVAGVVIYGAARDLPEIRLTGFPVFSTFVMPSAGEPKGFGEIGVPIRMQGMTVSPGDWIVGDDDGVCVIPREKAVEYTNRAMDVLERENRLRQEIQQGSTLSQVAYLLKWEKR